MKMYSAVGVAIKLDHEMIIITATSMLDEQERAGGKTVL